MSPFSLIMNLIVAGLLLTTLGFGLRLERRLKILRDSQAGFALAVADLDRAGLRAEKGLADLRSASEETLELLLGRIDKGRELAAKLEALTSEATAIADRVQVAPVAVAARPALEKVWTRPSAAATAPVGAKDDDEPLVLNLTRDAVAPERRPLRLEPRQTPRSRAVVDDDLFDSTPRGAGRRA
jgi:hypothetical protein